MVLITLVATMPPDVSAMIGSLVPTRYKPYVAAAPLFALWLKSHLNLVAPPPPPPPV